VTSSRTRGTKAMSEHDAEEVFDEFRELTERQTAALEELAESVDVDTAERYADP